MSRRLLEASQRARSAGIWPARPDAGPWTARRARGPGTSPGVVSSPPQLARALDAMDPAVQLSTAADRPRGGRASTLDRSRDSTHVADSADVPGALHWESMATPRSCVTTRRGAPRGPGPVPSLLQAARSAPVPAEGIRVVSGTRSRWFRPGWLGAPGPCSGCGPRSRAAHLPPVGHRHGVHSRRGICGLLVRPGPDEAYPSRHRSPDGGRTIAMTDTAVTAAGTATTLDHHRPSRGLEGDPLVSPTPRRAAGRARDRRLQPGAGRPCTPLMMLFADLGAGM